MSDAIIAEVLAEVEIKDEESNFNLIDRFPDIYDSIFSFLDFENLLQACLVCTSWNDFISQSSKLMQQIRVDLTKSFATPDRLEVIRRWKRKIFHLKVVPEENWCMSMPNDPIITVLNENASLLRSLSSLEIESKTLSSISNILTASNSLKKLQLTCNDNLMEDWIELSARFVSQLEFLSIVLHWRTSGMEQLLRIQTRLEKLVIGGPALDSELMEAIIKMEKLRDLHLTVFTGKFNSDVVGNMPSLEILTLFWDSLRRERETFLPIINSAPNLKTLDVYKLDQSLLDLAKSKMKKLERLNIRYFEAYEISHPELFPALQELKISGSIDYDMTKLLRQENVDLMTNFKRCLYNETISERHINWYHEN